jgi:excisionase family DNA binding protein
VGDGLVDVREAAALAGRAPETIRRWVWSGRLPARRSGRKLLVDRGDVLRIAARGAAAALTLSDWRRLVLQRLRDSARGQEAPASAADLVLSDRRSRDSTDGGGDAGR